MGGRIIRGLVHRTRRRVRAVRSTTGGWVTTSLPVKLKYANDIHPGIDLPSMHEAVRAERPLWTPAELHDLTSTVAARFATQLRDIVRFDTEQRWWTRLALTMGLELWLLSWLQPLAIHLPLPPMTIVMMASMWLAARAEAVNSTTPQRPTPN